MTHTRSPRAGGREGGGDGVPVMSAGSQVVISTAGEGRQVCVVVFVACVCVERDGVGACQLLAIEMSLLAPQIQCIYNIYVCWFFVLCPRNIRTHTDL